MDTAGIKRDHASILVGLALAAGCLFVAWEAWGYGLGSLRRMGAGFLPFALGLFGIALGLAMAWRGLRRAERAGEMLPLRRLTFIGAAFVFFAIAIEPLGLVMTLFVTTCIGAFADEDARVGQTVVLAGCLTGAIWLIFVYLLGLAIPLWPVER